MDTRINNGMCRCCASDGTSKDLCSTYHWMGDEEVYSDMLKECFDITLETSNEGGICEVCITQLRNASNFKKQVLKTEQQFKNILQDKLFRSSIVKVEVPTINDEDSDNDNHMSEDFSGTDYEIPIKMETPEEPKSKKRAAKATTSRTKKARGDDGETSTKRGQRSTIATTKHYASALQIYAVLKKCGLIRKDATNISIQHKPVLKNEIIDMDAKLVRKIDIVKTDKHFVSNTDVKRVTKIGVVKTDKHPVSKIKQIDKNNRLATNKQIIKIHTHPKQMPRKLKSQRAEVLKRTDGKGREISEAFREIIKHSHSKNVKIQGEKKVIDENDIEIPEYIKNRHNIRKIIKYSNATPIHRHTDLGYLCCFCNDCFLKPADLKIHTIYQHDDATKQKFMSRYNMDSILVKLDITDLKCNICHENFDSLDSFVAHLMAHNIELYTDIRSRILPFKFENPKTYNCALCGNSYFNFKCLQEHMDSHFKNYICEICGAGFVTPMMVRNHKKGHDTGVYKCEHCDKVFDNFRKKCYHVRTVHQGKLFNKCGYCNESFKNYYRKQLHLAAVHGIESQSMNCKICGKAFPKQGLLTHHINRYHNSEKPHK